MRYGCIVCVVRCNPLLETLILDVSFHCVPEAVVMKWLGVQIEGVYDPEEVGTSEDLMVDKCGNCLPPFIVMEKGESLIDWSKRNRSDVFQAVAVRPPPPLL